MGLLPEIIHRYSCQCFSEKPLQEAQITELLDAARLSPSAKNRQAWRFVAVTRKDLREKIASAAYNQEPVRTAPCIIVCGTTNIDYRMPNGQASYPIDLGLASGFVMLQATHLGLASCALSTFDEAQVKRIITMPNLMKAVLIIALGYAQDEAPERQRLPFSRICTENFW